MTISNHITLADIHRMPVGQISTQKPFSTLWKVTRSTDPARTSLVDCSGLMAGTHNRFAAQMTRPTMLTSSASRS